MEWTGDAIRAALRRYIAAHEISGNKWAKEAGLSEGTLRNFFSGRTRSLTQKTIEKLAAARGISAEELLGRAAPLKNHVQEAVWIATVLPPDQRELWIMMGNAAVDKALAHAGQGKVTRLKKPARIPE